MLSSGQRDIALGIFSVDPEMLRRGGGGERLVSSFVGVAQNRRTYEAFHCQNSFSAAHFKLERERVEVKGARQALVSHRAPFTSKYLHRTENLNP
jgi:hypothetical protein